MTEAPARPTDPSAIAVGPAIGTWAVTWLVGMGLLGPLVAVALGADVGDDLSIGVLAAASVAGWAVFVAGLLLASRRWGTGDPIADLAVRVRPVDLVGIPIGVATQLVLIPLLYVPLQHWWPDTFSDARIEERARDLADRAEGAWTLVLVLVVVVGAPLVEELVYRGLLQRSLGSLLGAVPGLVVTALWFALVHQSPVEYPGLALAGLVFGAGVVATRRLGLSIVTHAAFNAAGLVAVLA